MFFVNYLGCVLDYFLLFEVNYLRIMTMYILYCTICLLIQGRAIVEIEYKPKQYIFIWRNTISWLERGGGRVGKAGRGVGRDREEKGG